MQKKRFLRHLLSFLTLAAVILGAGMIEPAEKIPAARPTGHASADSEILSFMEEYSIMGLSFVVVRHGMITATGCYGWADRKRRVRTTEKTVYRVASISKTVTATAIMQLAESGKCSLDRDIGRYLGYQMRNPRYPKIPVTLRHLLTHTSGLNDGPAYDDFREASFGEGSPSLADILKTGGPCHSPNLWLSYPPGRRFNYSNLAFVIMGTIVERVSGRTFDEYCRAHILAPLGMTASFNIGHFKSLDSFAVLYHYLDEKELAKEENRGKETFDPSCDDYGSDPPDGGRNMPHSAGFNALPAGPQGGLRASPSDLARFMMAHLNNGSYAGASILRKNSAIAMRKPHWRGRDTMGVHRAQGLGFHITGSLIRGRSLVGHRGNAYGLIGGMYFNPANRTGFIALMNGGDYNRYRKKEDEFLDVEYRLYRLIYRYFIGP